MDNKNNQKGLNAADAHFHIHLHNTINADKVHAYVTGIDIQRTGLFFLRADGKTPYYPKNPTSTGAPLEHDCAIELGKPGSITQITVPRTESGRIYFSIGRLHFALNPGADGPSLVQPSPTELGSQNHDVKWGFAEFTWDLERMFANVSFVDFVGLPIALALKTSSGTQHVSGLPAGGIAAICKRLEEVASNQDEWSKLVMKSRDGDYLRAISPNNGMILYPKLFDGYYKEFVDKVWQKYQETTLLVKTHAFGTLNGHINEGKLHIGGESFAKPNTADIFSNSSGPFALQDEASEKRKAIVPVLCAGFDRSTLLTDRVTPDPDGRKDYYKNKITNHYAKIVHEVTPDGRGYAFPYDDVSPEGAKDQSGKVVSSDPQSLTITVGGN